MIFRLCGVSCSGCVRGLEAAIRSLREWDTSPQLPLHTLGKE